MRSGLWFSGAGGSGIFLARLPDGSWSPPSGLMLHTAGLGFLVGIDIYDCVMVINSDEALQGFSKLRATVGGELSAVAGPVGIGGVLDSEVHKRRAPIFTYMKSRGFYAGVQIDGTILIERTDENARFYNTAGISVKDIMAGRVTHPPYEIRGLMQTIKAAQGDKDVDESVLPSEPPPSDFEIVDSSKPLFGVPDKDDPDPYGVLALQKEGMLIREAGTSQPVSFDQFSFDPSPTSPVYSTFNRASIDGRTIGSRRGSWRASILSSTGMTDHSTQTTDAGCQTDFPVDTPATSPTLSDSRRMSEIVEEHQTPKKQPPPLPPRDATPTPSMQAEGTQTVGSPLKRSFTPEEIAPKVIEDAVSPTTSITAEQKPVIAEEATTAPAIVKVEEVITAAPVVAHAEETVVVDEEADDEVSDLEDDDDDDDDDFDVEIVEVKATVVQSVARAASPKRVVTVGRRPSPPPIPSRSERRRTTALTPTPSEEKSDPIAESSASVISTHGASDVPAPSVQAALSELRQIRRRSSSVSTYRERSSGHRSNSEASISSVEEMTGFERRLAAVHPHAEPAVVEIAAPKMEKEDEFHSASATPAAIEKKDEFESVPLH